LLKEINTVKCNVEVSDHYLQIINSLKDGSITVQTFQEYIAQDYFIDPFEHVLILFEEDQVFEQSELYPNRFLWNIFMFAVYYDRAEIVN